MSRKQGEIKFRYTFKRKSDGHIWQEIVPIECLEGKGDEPFVLKNYEHEWELIARDFFTGLLDKNNNEIYVGDVVEGFRNAMPTDGKIRKGFPNKIRVFLEVKWSDGKHRNAGFYLREIKVHPDDQEAIKYNQYRSIGYCLEESRNCFLNEDNSIPWYGNCQYLEIIGNIHSDPELLKK